MSPRREPTPAQAEELTAAAVAAFGKCDCHVHPDGRQCACAGHAFLLEDPTRRQGIRVWERLLFMRSQRTALLAQEGMPSPVPTPAHTHTTPTVLPW